jgi:membrane-associated phospholipid phosphatase
METILQWGLDCIRLIQTHASPPLNFIMRIITELGSSYAYLILLPFIYWCVDEKKGVRLAAAILISAWVNIALKLLLDQPRPFFDGYDPSADILGIKEGLGGFPSGHAQNSLVLWIIIASWVKKKRAYVIAAYAAVVFFCLLVGFSRVYLGVHFPTDVFGGWLLAGIILCVYFLTADRIEALLATRGNRAGLIACAALAFIMILYQPSRDADILKYLFMPAGLLLGMGTGRFFCGRYIGFSASSERTGTAKYLNLCVRFLLGITVMFLLYVGTGKIVDRFIESSNFRLFIFLRYILTALWVSAGAPWLFRMLRLSENVDKNVIHYQEHE